jgi:hypothetical protein
MADPKEPIPPKLKPGFFDVDPPSTQKLYQPPSMMKTTEWGGLTIVSLLASFLFPPYFIAVLTISFLNAGGLLWVTHLSEKARKALVEFEAEFRVGYQKEEAGKWKEAVAIYDALIPKYREFPKITQIAEARIAYLKQKHSRPAKKKPKS